MHLFIISYSVHSSSTIGQILIGIVHNLSKNHINAPDRSNEHVLLVHVGVTTIQYILYHTIEF